MKAAPPRFQGRQHTARTLALQILLDCRTPGPQRGFVGDVLDRQLTQHSLAPADRRLTTQLVYGVLRRRDTLQALIRPLLQRGIDKVEPWLQDALSLGAFQLALLSHIPPHAAVNETVKLAEQFGRPGAVGFLNGVLRALTRLLTDQFRESPSAEALPTTEGRYRLLNQPVFPDPARNRSDYLAQAFSLPLWLVRRWLPRWGAEECERMGFWFAGPAPLTLRCNPLKIDRAAFLAALAQKGLNAASGEHPQAVRLGDSAPIPELPGYEQGWFSVQDESAMGVATALAGENHPSPPTPLPQGARGERSSWRVLDLCAAPGGKTTHLAELLRDQGEIIACDIDAGRLETVEALARRLGLSSIRTQLIEGRDQASLPEGPFDAALVDVPCSNTGVLGRRPEVRWRMKEADLKELAALQAALLQAALERVRPGGVVVYSTCSIEPEENGELVRAVLRQRPGWILEAEQESRPGRPADGGYWARLVRPAP
jgi:16S rRNA (cytosine967-C5)-methyltransferase